MPLLRRKTDSGVHWSKDFIEHLRAVHFVVILSAVTCIAVSNVPSTKQLLRAQHDLRRIRTLVESATVSQKQRSESLKHPVAQSGFFLVVNYAGKNYFSPEPSEYETVEPCPTNDSHSELSVEGTQFLAEDWELNLTRIQTLDDFRTEWDSFHCGKSSHLVVEQILGTAIDDSPPEKLIPLTAYSGESSNLLKKGYIWCPLAVGYRNKQSLDENTSEAAKIKAKPIQHIFDGATTDTSAMRLEAFYGSINAFDDFKILVRSRDLSEKSFKGENPLPDVFERLIPEWSCRQSFAVCFNDVEQVGRAKRTHTLKDLSDEIDGELSRNERQFEVFGLKFPTDDLSRWGIILLIAVLGYFYLQLKELSERISVTDSGLEVAWFGLYASKTSFCLMWLSLVILPCVAVLIMGIRGAQVNQTGFAVLNNKAGNFLFWELLPTLGCLIVSSLACLSARRLAILAASARRMA